MRQLKFRAWNEHRKEMEYIDDLYWFEENHVHSVADQLSDYDWKIQQFTGLKDSLGKDIYEGDLVDIEIYAYFDGWEKKTGQEVIYSEEYMMFVFGTEEWSMSDRINHTSLKVVGNIYERNEAEST